MATTMTVKTSERVDHGRKVVHPVDGLVEDLDMKQILQPLDDGVGIFGQQHPEKRADTGAEGPDDEPFENEDLHDAS